jgi:hypothetical protein
MRNTIVVTSTGGTTDRDLVASQSSPRRSRMHSREARS